jgi:MFS family permease
VTLSGSTYAAAAPADSTATSPTPNRWRVPLGAVLVHLCIGSVYAWSTLNRPIQQLFADQPWWLLPPYTTFTTALAMLGLSAAIGGPWVERRGPRVAARAAALFFGVGLVVGGFGLSTHQPLLVLLGMGVIGGIGCGLGYIAPVSTLVKWFPDRRGMATGMAIMGFGGGAFIAGFLNVFLIARIGIANTVMVLGVVYLTIMLLGSMLLVSPPAGWAPPGWRGRAKDAVTPKASGRTSMIATHSVSRNAAVRTRQFALL